MGWKQPFDDAMKELQETRRQLERLDDPTIGLSALHGELAQSRLKIQELVQTGVTGLREENREVRRRQDRMISDLNETRGELRQLLDLADVLRPLALSRTDDPEAEDEPQEQLEEALHQPPGHSAAPASRGPEPGPAAPKQYAEPNTDRRGETMESASHQPQPATGSDDKDQVLKNAIEAAYRGHGTGNPAQASLHTPQENRPDDPRVTHGCPASEGRRRRFRRPRRTPRHLGMADRPGSRPQPLPPSRTSRKAASRLSCPGAHSYPS
ncbi:hypothetical protein PV350_44865 [Streptomyces sp. PA03-6a]|nr:hypothetical protein [Streptomyces sp. PA03-6a]